MNNFKKQMKEYKKKHGVEDFKRKLRRFKRRFTSSKKKEEEYRKFYKELSRCFTAEPAVCYPDQPH